MKPNFFLSCIISIFLTTPVFSQKAEKIKGSKIVTASTHQVEPFSMIEVEDNLEIYLEKGEKNEIKIEADDNLHDIIGMDLREKTLRLYTNKESSIFKKLSVKVTYTKSLNKVKSVLIRQYSS